MFGVNLSEVAKGQTLVIGYGDKVRIIEFDSIKDCRNGNRVIVGQETIGETKVFKSFSYDKVQSLELA